MKKLKHLLSTFMVAALSLSLVFSVACSTGGGNEDTEVLQSISVDASAAKTSYLTGESFSYSGIVVTATVNKGSETDTRDVTSEAVVDSSAYNGSAAGTYSISVSYSLNDVTKTANYNVTVSEPVITETLKSITVDATKAKTEYEQGDSFTSAGIVVTASIQKSNSSTPETVDVTSSAVVDSSSFNGEVAGEYGIIVSYTLNGVTVRDTYIVSVAAVYMGVNVVLSDEVSDTVYLSSENSTADLSTIIDGIEVRTPDRYEGSIDLDADPLDASAYTVSLIKGKEEIDSEDWSSLGEGVYQIWVTLNSKIGSYVFKGFTLIYVVDQPVSIAFNGEAAGTITEQQVGKDIISSTWNYVVTFGTGATKDITSSDVTVDIDTRVVGENKIATVTYDTEDALGTPVTLSTTVTYTIVANQNVTLDPVEISFDSLTAGDYTVENIGDIGTVGVSDYSLISADIAHTTTDKLTVKTGSETAIAGTGYVYTNYLQTQGGSRTSRRSVVLELNTEYNYTITVYAMSGSSTGTGRYVAYYQTSTTAGSAEDYAANTVGDELSVSEISATVIDVDTDNGGVVYVGGSASIYIYHITVTPVEKETKEVTDTVVNISTLVANGELAIASYTELTWLDDGVCVTASENSTVSVDANNKSMDGYSFTHRLKLEGAGSADARSVKLEIDGAAKITVYMMSSSSTATRDVSLYDSDFTAIDTQQVGGTALEKHEYSVTEAGVYYIAALSGVTNIYCIIISAAE